MTTLASALLARITRVLQDTGYIRWSEAELLDWIGDGQLNVVILKPDACIVNGSVQLVAGAKQSLPATAAQLIDIPRNMGTNGTTPGDAIRISEREDLDANDPGWMTATPAATVLNYVHNALDPLHFYIYPPQPTSAMGYVEIIYSSIPVAPATSASNIGIADIYAPMLVDYVLYRAYQKDAENQGNAGRSSAHLANFLNTLGIQTKNKINPAGVTFPHAPGGDLRENAT